MELFSFEEGLLFLLILVVVFCLTSTVAYLLHYIGLIQKVKVSVGKPLLGNVWIAYKHHVGRYKDSGPHFTEVTSLCPDLECIEILYDDPNLVSEDKVRYIVGVILCQGDEKPSQSVVTLLSSHDYHTFQLPSIDYAVRATFPYILNVCAFLGSWKVYPALHTYIKLHKLSAHPFIEYYSNNTIHYMAPLSKQNDFFVSQVEYKTKGSQKTSLEKDTDDTPTESASDEESQGTASSFEEITAEQVQQ